MKRLLSGIIFSLVISAMFVVSAHASVNNFSINDFQADYYLDKDSDGRSTLKTVEVINAQFPDFDQNHGIERAIPLSYDGHSVSLNVQSVKDQNGVDLDYTTSRMNDNLVLRIGKADTYVYGANIYQITYTQRDVTRFFADTNDDEFYWDVNGNEWSQKFDDVTARLHVADGILNSMTDDMACYYGVSESKDVCTIAKDGNLLTANVTNIGASQNMTIAVGFAPHTFSSYQMSAFESAWRKFMAVYLVLAMVASVVTVILLVSLAVLKYKKGQGAPGRGIIIPKYLPPSGVDVALSSVIIKKPVNWTAATYIDLAVRHNIRIFESEKGIIFKRKIYSFELISLDRLTDSEMMIVKALFGNNLKIGEKHDLNASSSDYNLVSAISKIYKQSKVAALSDGYYEINKKLRSTMIKITVTIAVLVIFTTFWGIISLIIAVCIIVTTKPLTVKGRELLDYLKGLEMYIKTAEEDRIKVLQSPQGAEKTPVDINDSKLLVHLYERVLPYAVLFGSEKEWSGVLGKFYEQQDSTPDWYVGTSAFNAVMFSSALSSFSSSASSYSSPSSSSSGGSGGGGSSGGGGGGGGGGGW
jgi:uncharacterized membrane protein YgcG